jgi:hypothetical protein
MVEEALPPPRGQTRPAPQPQRRSSQQPPGNRNPPTERPARYDTPTSRKMPDRAVDCRPPSASVPAFPLGGGWPPPPGRVTCGAGSADACVRAAACVSWSGSAGRAMVEGCVLVRARGGWVGMRAGMRGQATVRSARAPGVARLSGSPDPVRSGRRGAPRAACSRARAPRGPRSRRDGRIQPRHPWPAEDTATTPAAGGPTVAPPSPTPHHDRGCAATNRTEVSASGAPSAGRGSVTAGTLRRYPKRAPHFFPHARCGCRAGRSVAWVGGAHEPAPDCSAWRARPCLACSHMTPCRKPSACRSEAVSITTCTSPDSSSPGT